ncbi:rhamnogalacturonan acetylesterase [Paenibacillus caseinilyticus]|nr:rhamnogalacturonan acetylesterase [Paenibacillus caseinilyticus]MCZ8518497.1 rhamnogalacturonan acetylesterase [Paenibacillus caseinilyticus]
MTKPVTVYIAGDSTAANYPEEKRPMSGWGEWIGSYLTGGVRICNEARNGRSSKSYIGEGHFDRIAAGIGEGDYLLVQFGHNDQKPDESRHTDPGSTYEEHLLRYIEMARGKGAYPVLLTSVERRAFDEAGVLVPSHGEYPDAVRRLAEAQRVPLLDLCHFTQRAYRKLGSEASKGWFVWLEPGEHPNYPEGERDNTHFNELGARNVAGLVAQALAASDSSLAGYLKTGSGG